MFVPIKNREIRNLLLALPGKAVQILHKHYYERLLIIAQGLVHDEDAAKDIVQETFQHVWLKSRQLGKPDDRSIHHYLVKVVRFKAITYFKEGLKEAARRKEFFNGHCGDASAKPWETIVIEDETVQEIRNVIARFPRRERECLTMRIDEGLNNHEISQRTGVSVKAVERSLASAKKRLRKMLRIY